jgi:hypothetical protein
MAPPPPPPGLGVVGFVFGVLFIQRGREKICEGSLSRDKFLF